MIETKVTATLEDGTQLIWYPGEEVKATVEVIESFLGPADRWIEP